MRQRLNATQIKQAKPKAKPYKVADGGGRFWRYRYRLLGKENVVALGTYPETTLP